MYRTVATAMTQASLPRILAALGLSAAIAAAAVGGAPLVTHAAAPRAARLITVVAGENEYGDVIKQIGGSHVNVLSVLSNPNADPHTYEASTTIAGAVARAQLIVVNGIGYDDFMTKLESASPSTSRVVIDVGKVFGRKAGDNPHQWYDPTTMPKVAALVAAQLAKDDPADKAAFQANVRRFDASLAPYISRLAAIKRRFGGTPVAITEPVFGYALNAMGLSVLTPHRFSLAIQEGNDPSPQDAQVEANLLSQNKVKLFAYNQQTVVPATQKLLPIARAHHIPIIGVYETEPLSRSYQQWMVAEADAVMLALTKGVSTEKVL